MTQATRIGLNHILLGDELGQIKLVQLYSNYDIENNEQDVREQSDDLDNILHQNYLSSTLDTKDKSHHHHRIVRVLDERLQKGPAISRAITNIRPIEGIYENSLDTTDKPNNLFLITNKIGQIFVCDTDAIRTRLKRTPDVELNILDETDPDFDRLTPMLSPIYYNMNSKVPVCGGQPINQTNLLVIYQNGDIQYVNIGQDVLQSTLKIKRKAIRILGMGYNSDARAIHWRIDGSSGICYFDSDSSATHMDENDPLTNIVLKSPTHKLSRKRVNRSQQNLYNKSPCIKSRKYNEEDRLVPVQLLNLLTTRPEQYKPTFRTCKWTTIDSLNLLYKKLALYDLVSSDFEKSKASTHYNTTTFKLNHERLAVGGYKYSLRVYDVQAQKAIYNCLTGSSKNPLACPYKGEPVMISDIDWLGGNKTTKRPPNMLATCSGLNAVVNVYDLRSPKPVFHIDLTDETEDRWQLYENYPRGCMFTQVCAFGAPCSTAVPSQQLALGSTNGQLHIIDLRFLSKIRRTLGQLSGFCGGSLREIRFVSESFENSKIISCATDRFIRIHKIQTSFTSVISQKLATKVFLGTRPTCIQPVCDEIRQSYLSSIIPRCGSESHISTMSSGGWSIL